MSENNQNKDTRARNFATIVYPESAPENWLDTLESHCVPAFISPLHDKDINPTGEPKKAHYHVMLMFEGKKSHEQVKEIFDSIGGVGLDVVKSMRAYARYLCHLDNPEKAQYNIEDVRSIASDYIGVIGLALDRYSAISDMQDFCDKYEIKSFGQLNKYARRNRSDWWRVLCDSGSYVMDKYIKSCQWARENNIDLDIVDPETGEIIK